MLNQTLTAVQKDDIVEGLRDAQNKLYEVIAAVEAYVTASDDGNAGAYLLDQLKIMASSGHGFLSNALNFDDVISRATAWCEGESSDEEN